MEKRTTSFLPSFPNLRKNLESSAWAMIFIFLKVIKLLLFSETLRKENINSLIGMGYYDFYKMIFLNC